jgi:hypothetical protein
MTRSCDYVRCSCDSGCLRRAEASGSRFVLVDFRYTSDAVGHIRLEAGCMYAMPRALAHAAAKRELVAIQQPDDWTPPSIVRLPELLTESELVEADGELKALQRHALAIVDREMG